VEFATPLSHDKERIDAYHGSETLRYRTMEGFLGDQPVPGLVPHNLEATMASLVLSFRPRDTRYGMP
jgi:hypothetical protein